VYTATELQESRIGLRVGLAEQFTRFGTLQRDGKEVENPANEWLDSSITQLVAGYSAHPRLLAQVNTPLIRRAFRRSTHAGPERGDESGVGDVSLHFIGTVHSTVRESGLQRLSASVGVKFPTGSTRRLREELDENAGAAGSMEGEHGSAHEHESGIHGHDLALGTGSTDVVLGAQWLGTYRRLYGTASMQYFVRTQGAHGYTYADETILSGTTGLFLRLEHDRSLGLQASLSVETKGTDSLRGERVADTGATTLYASPGLRGTWHTALSAELDADVPAIRNNSALQIVPDFRVRAGLVWRF